MIGTQQPSELKMGNTAFRNKDYVAAICHYLRALHYHESLMGDTIRVNLRLARYKYRVQRSSVVKSSAAICCWGLVHPVPSRVHTLAKLYQTFSDVEVLGTILSESCTEIWEPLRHVEIPLHSILVEDENCFLDQALLFVAAHPYDIIHLSSAHIPNILFGILYKLIWDAKVLIDIDTEEISYSGADIPISFDDYIKIHGNLPAMVDLAGKEWTRLAISMVTEFDGITVSNSALQKRYGGTIISPVWHDNDCQCSTELKHKSQENHSDKLHAEVLNTLVRSNAKRSEFEQGPTSWYSGFLDKTTLYYLITKDSKRPQTLAHLVGQSEESEKAKLQKFIDLVGPNALFDRAWYLAKYQDVRKRGIDPIYHYLRYGAGEGRDPGPCFSTSWYLKEYSDVRCSGSNPLVHFLQYGQQEGRFPIPPNRKACPWWAQFTPDLQARSLGISRDASIPIDVSGALARMARNRLPPAIIIPIYNAPVQVDDCLRSLLLYNHENCRIIVIDDASPDPEISRLLTRYHGISPIEIYRNEENLGFTRTINRGIGLAGEADVVFLNSDTKVTPGWLRNLRIAVYSGERIGTVTPLSNNAGAFSAPVVGKDNPLPVWLSLDEYARAITQSTVRAYPKVPTGNGFCLYVRRDCLNETGLLDEAAFPRGYGEENDFCMRAGRLGWKHVIDDATLIYHVRSASFGDAKTDLMGKGRAIIDARYPEYAKEIRKFTSCEHLNRARERIGAVASAFSPGKGLAKPRVLYVLSTSTGGTPQTNQDLMKALDDRIEAFVLHCNASMVTLTYFQDDAYVEMEVHVLNEPIKAFPHRSDEYDAVVASWIVKYAIELVHIRHIAWHGLGLVDISKALGLPVVFSFHDFYTICPTVKLLDNADQYCGGKCTASEGQCTHELWTEPDFPPLKNAGVKNWHKQFATILEKCDLLITTTESARKIISENYEGIKDRAFFVIPHGRDFDAFEQLAKPIDRNENIRIIIPGNISKAKGATIINQLGKIASQARIEIHLLGDVSEDVEVTAGIIFHGTYKREQFAEKVRAIKPHIGGIFSIWPETYCHTLTELWACGVPVIGFDFGAVGDRLRESSAGWLTAGPTANDVLQIIDRLHTNVKEHGNKLAAVKKWQVGIAGNNDCHHMGHSYYDLYRSVMIRTVDGRDGAPRRPQVAILAPNTNVKNYRVIGAPASTHIRLLEKTRDALERAVRYDVVDSKTEMVNLMDQYDAILVQRTALSENLADKLIRLACLNSCPIIVELDDDLIERSFQADLYGEYAGNVETLKKLLSAGSLVIVSTETLKSRLTAYAKKLVVCRNAISERLWLAPLLALAAGSAIPAAYRRKTTDEIRIVYMGSKTHLYDLMLLKDAMCKVRKRFSEVRLFTVGITDVIEDWFEPINVPADSKNYTLFVPWVRAVLATMDLAVAPLVDGYFNHAKSALKFLEYSAVKLPSICSNLSPYNKAVRHAETGLLANNTAFSWAEQINYAIQHPTRMQDMVKRAHNEVVLEYLLRGQDETFDKLLLETIYHSKTDLSAN